MADPKDYEGTAEIQFDSSTLAEAESVSIRHNPNHNRVYTMKRGLAGYSKGAFESEISVTNAVPKAGLEQEFIEKCVEGAKVRITHLFAGRRYRYSGWIDSIDHSNAVQDSATLSFTVVSGPPSIS